MKNLLTCAFAFAVAAFVSLPSFANETKTVGRYGATAKKIIQSLTNAGFEGEGALGTIWYVTSDLHCSVQIGYPADDRCDGVDLSTAGAKATKLAAALAGFGVTPEGAMGGRRYFEVQSLTCKIHNNTEDLAQKYGCSITFTNVE